MPRNWRIFEEALPPTKDAIYASINSVGELLLNKHAYDLIDRPEAVIMMHEPETYSIGIQKAERMMPNAFKVRKKSDATNYVIRAKPFCDHLEIKYERTVRFLDAKLEDGVLAINLTKTTRVTRKKRP